jgi:hypothetical protein
MKRRPPARRGMFEREGVIMLLAMFLPLRLLALMVFATFLWR